jgi:hypothetical protein
MEKNKRLILWGPRASKSAEENMKHSIICTATALAALSAGAITNGLAQQTDATTTATAVTNVTGTIKQLNYGSDGEVDGFLAGTNILLTFPSGICGGIESLGAAGNSITYSGTELTATSGFETVNVTSLTNTTTKVTYTAPTSNALTTYGPASGTVKQLNYADGGGIDGFVFAPASATSIFVSTGPNASTALTSLLTVGATVSVTGTASPSMSACSSTGALEAVNPSSLTIGTQTIVFSGGGGNHGAPGFGGPGGHH